MTSSEILFGLGLVLVLAVGSQLLARRLRVPAIVVLLPAGFIAGIATSDVNPENLLGSLYQPFVSLAVGVILFEAGLGLSLREAPEGVRPVVSRLVAVGIVVTCLGVAGTVSLLFDGLSTGVAFVMGAILVVSGPTVVLPLLAFIRPARQVRSALTWEGVLVDPVGAIFGVLVFHAVSTGAGVGDWHPGVFLSSVAVGAAVGAAGAVVLWALLREIHRNEPRMAVLATLMVVIAAVVASDLIREDAGLVAATVMGVALGNQHLLRAQHRIDVSLAREFHETLVQLLIGVLFVMIAASVTPDEVRSVLADALALVAVMVLILRPLTVALATWRSGFTARERGFMAWMAPRGIVAGATASAFGLALRADGVAGSAAVLPTVFIVIFATVVLYGLTAPLVARRLGVAEKQRRVVLIVGGHEWARELALALARSGVAVRMWVGRPDDRAAAQAAGLEAGQGRMVVDAVSREAELEEVTDALLLTASDDFNALAAAHLRPEVGHGHVFRVAPDSEASDLAPPREEAGILGHSRLTFAELSRRVAAGARFAPVEASADGHAGEAPWLVAVSANGELRIAADGRPLPAEPGSTVIALVPPATAGAVASSGHAEATAPRGRPPRVTRRLWRRSGA